MAAGKGNGLLGRLPNFPRSTRRRVVATRMKPDPRTNPRREPPKQSPNPRKMMRQRPPPSNPINLAERRTRRRPMRTRKVHRQNLRRQRKRRKHLVRERERALVLLRSPKNDLLRMMTTRTSPRRSLRVIGNDLGRLSVSDTSTGSGSGPVCTIAARFGAGRYTMWVFELYTVILLEAVPAQNLLSIP